MECVEELVVLGIEVEYYGFDVINDEVVIENVKVIGEKYG